MGCFDFASPEWMFGQWSLLLRCHVGLEFYLGFRNWYIVFWLHLEGNNCWGSALDLNSHMSVSIWNFILTEMSLKWVVSVCNMQPMTMVVWVLHLIQILIFQCQIGILCGLKWVYNWLHVWTMNLEELCIFYVLTLKVLNFWKFTWKWSGWISNSYCGLKPNIVGYGGSSAGSYLCRPYIPHPLPLCCNYPVYKSQCINCLDKHFMSYNSS